MKKLRMMTLLLMMCLLLASCCISHEWADAACTTPKTCTKCGETEGEALGHDWVDATCTTPKTCSVCGEIEGEALGHTYETVDNGIDFITATQTIRTECTVCGDVSDELTQEHYTFVDSETKKFLFTGEEFAARMQNQLDTGDLSEAGMTCEFDVDGNGNGVLDIYIIGEQFCRISFLDENNELMDASVKDSRDIHAIQLMMADSLGEDAYYLLAREVSAAISPSIKNDPTTALAYIVRGFYVDDTLEGVNYYDIHINEHGIFLLLATANG